jgi:hypothetical protein
MKTEERPNTSVQTSDEDAEILKEARDWMSLVALYEADIREESAKCVRFRSGEQWDQTILQSRGAARPSLVMDHTGQFIDQVVNDWRKNRVGIQVSPGDDSADDETAQIVDGLIREIEYRSKAHVAYDRAFDQMVGQNRSFLRVTTEYRKGTWRKDIKVKHIQNPDCVYFDPFAVEADYSDAMRCLVTDRLGKKQYHAEWGKKAPEIDFAAYKGTEYGDWITEDAITVAEWWVVKEIPRKIQRLTRPIAVIRNGRALQTDAPYDDEYDELPPGITIRLDSAGELMERDEPKREVWQYIINGVQVLDKVLWEGSRIPIKPMYGKELFVNGKKRLYALISRQLDAQQALNYTISASVQAVALVPVNPLVGLVGQDKTNQKQIAESNRVPYAFLGFDPVQLPDGTWHFDIPQRQNSEPQIQGLSYMSQQLVQFMKAEVGMYGASLGDREGKVRSGAAEKALQNEGDNATLDFPDNGSRAVELVGCDIVELIPIIYSQAELIQIRDAQNRVLNVAVNQDVSKMQNRPKDQDGKPQARNYFLTQGSYNVAITAAPSHDTLRKEGQQALTDLLQFMQPEMAAKAVPAIMRLSGIFSLKEVADEIDPPKDGADIPPEVIQRIQMSDKLIKSLTEEIHSLKDSIDNKKMELDEKWREASLKAYVDLRKAEIAASQNAAAQDANIAAGKLEQMWSHAHEVGMAAMQQQHSLEQGEQGHQQTLEQTQQAADLAPEPEPAGAAQ